MSPFDVSQRRHRVLAVVRHPVGGVRTHILYTYPLLLAAGYRFTFVVPNEDSNAQFRSEVVEWPDSEVVAVPNGKRGGSPQFRPAVRRLLKQGRFSLIHSHGIGAAVPTWLANFGIHVPHVMTSQDVFCHVNVEGIRGRLKLLALERLLRQLDVLIAVSNDTRDDHLRHLPRLRKGPCRIVVMPNGIDLNRYPLLDDEPASLRKKLGIGSETFLLGFLGRFMEQKGFLDLIEALERIFSSAEVNRPVRLLAVGSGDCLVNYRKVLLRHPNAARNIAFMDHVPVAAPVLRELDLLVMPSLWEACPILPMEAMCMGVPVLGTSCLGLREVLQGTPSVMVPPGDCDALAGAIRRAIASPWTESARRYASKAQERFDVRRQAARLQQQFDELVSDVQHV